MEGPESKSQTRWKHFPSIDLLSFQACCVAERDKKKKAFVIWSSFSIKQPLPTNSEVGHKKLVKEGAVTHWNCGKRHWRHLSVHRRWINSSLYLVLPTSWTANSQNCFPREHRMLISPNTWEDRPLTTSIRLQERYKVRLTWNSWNSSQRRCKPCHCRWSVRKTSEQL